MSAEVQIDIGPQLEDGVGATVMFVPAGDRLLIRDVFWSKTLRLSDVDRFTVGIEAGATLEESPARWVEVRPHNGRSRPIHCTRRAFVSSEARNMCEALEAWRTSGPG